MPPSKPSPNQPSTPARGGDPLGARALAALVFAVGLLALWVLVEVSCTGTFSRFLSGDQQEQIKLPLQVLHQCLWFLIPALGLGFALVLLLDALESGLSPEGDASAGQGGA